MALPPRVRIVAFGDPTDQGVALILNAPLARAPESTDATGYHAMLAAVQAYYKAQPQRFIEVPDGAK